MGASIEQLYEISREIEDETDYINIYNRLVKMCDSIMRCDKFSFNLKLFDNQDIKEFLKVFLEILDSDRSILRKPMKENVKTPNRKLMSQLEKEDIDNYLDDMIKVFVAKGNELHGTSFFIPVFHSRKSIDIELAKAQSYYRNYIRQNKHDNPFVLFDKCSTAIIEDFSRKIDEVKQKNNYGMKNLMVTLYMIYMQEGIFSYILFQIINYKIINNNKISSKIKCNILDELTNMAMILSQRKLQSKRKPNIFDGYSTYLFYLDLRNKYKTEIEIMRILKEQMDNPDYICNVDDRYQCRQRYVQDIKTKKELQEIILEGKNDKEERFNKNLSDVGDLMLLLNIMAGRSLFPEYLQHTKVVYREIIEDPLKYNNKQSRTIMRNLEKKGNPYFEQIKESVFIREKISRGLFRELGLLQEYRLKNNFQDYYYQTLLSCMSFYDALDIAENLQVTFEKIADSLKPLLKPIT